MIRVDHNPDSGSGCRECGRIRGVIKVNLHDLEFFLCAVHWEELVLKLQGKPVPG